MLIRIGEQVEVALFNFATFIVSQIHFLDNTIPPPSRTEENAFCKAVLPSINSCNSLPIPNDDDKRFLRR